MNVMNRVFSSFEEENVKYISFKSNLNLADSFAGKADFDVLVDPSKIGAVETILTAHDGKRFNPVRYGRYPGVDNWIIFDSDTGILYHLHLHYQIATGKALIKDYVIPWTDVLLESRVKDPEFQIYKSDPNMELLLLTVRSVLKSHFSDAFKAVFGVYHLHSSLQEEKTDLLSQVDENLLRQFALSLFGTEDGETIGRLALKERISAAEFRQLSGVVRKSMRLYRRFSGFGASVRAAAARFGDVYNKILARKFGKIWVTKKVSLEGGAIIAFVGPDGAGKSTVTTEMQKWISRKIECRRFYMGTGDGKTTLFGSLIKKAASLSHTSGGEAATESALKAPSRVCFSKQPKKYLKRFIKMLLVYDVEKNNVKKIKAMNRYRLNGGISVLDRYPQIEIAGQNDGPKIITYKDVLGDTPIVRSLARKEAEYLSIVKVVKPDAIVRLNISTETGLSRKADLRKDDPVAVRNYTKKIEEMKRIRYQGSRIIEVDAEQKYEDELLEIKRILWREVL